MFYRDLKSNVKNEIIKKRMQHINLNIFIFATINIDNNWYKRILKNKFEKNMHDKTDIYYNKLIKYWKDYYRKKKNYDNEIIFEKLNSIEYREK